MSLMATTGHKCLLVSKLEKEQPQMAVLFLGAYLNDFNFHNILV